MSNKLASLAVAQPSAQLAFHYEPPSNEVWSIMQQQASLLVKSGFLPSAIKTEAQAIAVMLKARELNVPTMYGLSHISIIEGKPSVSAELMFALVRRMYGTRAIRVAESTNERCVVEYRVSGWEQVQTTQFRLEDAKIANLAGKPTWRAYPAAMLRARAISAACRMAFPECIAGMYAAGELGDDVTISGEGEVVSVGTYRVGLEEPDAADLGLDFDIDDSADDPEGNPVSEDESNPKARERGMINRDLHTLVGQVARLYDGESLHERTREVCKICFPVAHDDEGNDILVRSMTDIPTDMLAGVLTGLAKMKVERGEKLVLICDNWYRKIASVDSIGDLNDIGGRFVEMGVTRHTHRLLTDAWKDRKLALLNAGTSTIAA